MRLLILLLCALLAAPAAEAAGKKKKPAATKKTPKVRPEPEPEPEPAKPAAVAKSTVLLDTNPPAVAGQLEAALQSNFNVGVADTALPDDIDRDSIVKAAKKGRAVAVVTARYANGVWIVRTWGGADGAVLAEVTFKAPKEGAKAVVPKPGLSKLMAAAQKAESGASSAAQEETASGATTKTKEPATGKEPAKSKEPEKRQEPEEKVETEEAPAPAEEGEKPEALHIGAGIRIVDRKLSYTDDLFGALSRYTQPLAPRIAFELEFFPGAFATSGPASWFGITGGLDFLVAVTAVAADGTRYPTNALRVRANVAARIPIANRLEIGITFGYQLATYGITGEAATKPNVPDTAYSALRPAASLGLRLVGPLWIKAGFGYQAVLDAGQIKSAQYFPRATVGGLDLDAGVVVHIVRFLEVKAAFEYERYWYSMNPEVGDPYIAGGALDDSRGFSVFAAFTF
jgi:hypothetical protein